jgi:hypothetical protein
MKAAGSIKEDHDTKLQLPDATNCTVLTTCSSLPGTR